MRSAYNANIYNSSSLTYKNMTKIELDNIRISKYQELKNNLEAVKEFFRHGDILIKQVNNLLQETKDLIDNAKETSFTTGDFDDMLLLRNEVLAPIFQNASFAVEFTPYGENPVIVAPEPEIITKVDYQIINGELMSGTIIEKLDGRIVKTTNLSYYLGKLVERKITEGTTTTIEKFIDGVLMSSITTSISDNVAEITKKTYEQGNLISTVYSKYVDGVLTENVVS